MSKKVCVIGAGCSGITAIKNLLQAGVTDIVCYERNIEIGGNWVYTANESHSSVCETTHIISSKTLSEYVDFPMPADYPDYPSHLQVLDYFRSYVKHFKLAPYIQFNTEVKKIEQQEGNRWSVTIQDGTSQVFDYLILCNGHHSVPSHPEFKNDFKGEYLHSHHFKNNQGFEGKRVVVIGAGNSACDCAVEISRVAKNVSISIRRSQYIIPKFVLGKPADTLNKGVLFLPKGIRNVLLKIALRLQIGKYSDYGLPEPDYPVTKAHPTVNSELLYKIRHGKVHPRKGIDKIEGKIITFKDGTKEEYDTMVAATGYKMVFPFLEKTLLNFEDATDIPLYLRMIHPNFQTLFFVGLTQPQGCVWPISDVQSKLLANHIMGRWAMPKNIKALAEVEANQIKKDFNASPRHSVEVHFHEFVAKINKEMPRNAPETFVFS